MFHLTKHFIKLYCKKKIRNNVRGIHTDGNMILISQKHCSRETKASFSGELNMLPSANELASMVDYPCYNCIRICTEVIIGLIQRLQIFVSIN